MTSPTTMLDEASAALEARGGLALGDLDGIVAAAVSGLPRSAWWVPGVRERAGGVLRGASAERLATGDALPPYRIAASVAPAGLRALHALGLALVGEPVLVHLGVAALADGGVYEALNLAALQGAPLIAVFALRDLTGAPVPAQSAAAPAALAAALGLRCVEAHGPELADAVAEAAAAEGPTIILTAPFSLSSAASPT